MESVVLDSIVGSSLVPTIMSTHTGKMYGEGNSDLLYATVTIGTVLGALFSSLHSEIRLHTRSRNWLTLLTSGLITASLFASIVLFHLVRHNFSPTNSPYKLPDAISSLRPSEPSEVFRRHLHADIIPGFLIFTQVLACLMIRFELLNRAKRKFSNGEASILAQLASAAYLVWCLTIYSKLSGAGPFQVSQTTDIILNLGMTLFAVVFLPAYLALGQRRSTFGRYCILAAGLVASFTVTRSLVKTTRINDPLTWLVDYIFSTHQRISLFSLWLSALAGTVSFSTSWSRMVGSTNSLARKVFHLAICVVFVTGYNQDLEFTRFAAGGMVLVMLALEMIRAWDLWPMGGHLENVCQSLRGKWDNRYITVSHMYLLIGTMIPLWLLPPSSGIAAVPASKLSLSSGLIAVGVGDAAAAIVGTLQGKTQLGLKSGKTLEGFLGNIIAMAAFKLAWVGYSGFLDEFSFAFAAVLTAFVEAISCNCDNLTLPLVMMLLLDLF